MSQGGSVAYASPPGFVHTSYALFGLNETGGGAHPPSSLFESHNEWFWPHNDSKAYGQLCWSNASLVSFLIDQVRTLLRSQPNANIISVSQNDNYNYCKDPGDLAIIKEEGSPIGSLLRAVNAIAGRGRDEERERERVCVCVCVHAYLYIHIFLALACMYVYVYVRGCM